MKVVVVGAGGHAQVVTDILLQQQKHNKKIQPIGYLDDRQSLHGHMLLGLPVLGGVDLLSDNRVSFDKVIIAIGDNRVRQRVAKKIDALAVPFATTIHPTAVIGSDVKIGPGSMVCANAVINSGSCIGSHCIINTAATVDHHSHVGDFVHLAPGTHTGGEVSIKPGAFLGIGSLVLPRKTIGEWAIVGGGAVVSSEIKDNETVVGIPARPIKR